MTDHDTLTDVGDTLAHEDIAEVPVETLGMHLAHKEQEAQL